MTACTAWQVGLYRLKELGMQFHCAALSAPTRYYSRADMLFALDSTGPYAVLYSVQQHGKAWLDGVHGLPAVVVLGRRNACSLAPTLATVFMLCFYKAGPVFVNPKPMGQHSTEYTAGISMPALSVKSVTNEFAAQHLL
jgi:hypothetical protein